MSKHYLVLLNRELNLEYYFEKTINQIKDIENKLNLDGARVKIKAKESKLLQSFALKLVGEKQ